MLNDLRYALRQLRKNPGFTAVAALTLALGIGANTAMFSVVNAVLLRSLPYDEPDGLVRVWSTLPAKGIDRMGSAPPDFRELRDQNQVFAQMAAYYFRGFTLTERGGPQRLQGLTVSANLFQVLGVQPALGRGFLPEEETLGRQRVVVLSHGLWQRRFGSDPGIINEALTLDGETFTVIGIMPAQFQFPNPQLEVWTPMAFAPDDVMNTRSNHFVDVVARLRSGVTLPQALANAETIAQRLQVEYKENAGLGMTVDSYTNALVGNVRLALLVLLGTVGFVLLIACANMANLLLAKAAAREKEIAIRTALGAGRLRLVRQLLTESVLLALLGGTLGILLAFWGVEGLIALSTQYLPRAQEIGIDSRVLGFMLLLSLLTGLAFGLAPAWQGSRLLPSASLKEGARSFTATVRARSLRSVLMISEVALSLVLLIGAGLLIKSFYRLLQVNPGFRPEQLLTAQITLPSAKYREPRKVAVFFEQLLKDLETLPGLQAVGTTTSLPLSSEGGWGKNLSIEGRPVTSLEQVPLVQHRQVSPGYFSAMRIPLRKGRFFTEQDNEEATPVAVINMTLARRFWSNEDPIGKIIWMGPPESLIAAELLRAGYRYQDVFPRMTIVGVVEDVKHAGLSQEAGPEVFIPHLQGGEETSRSLFLAVRTTTEPPHQISAVRSRVSALDKEQPISNVLTMEQRLSHSLSRPRSMMLLLGLFAALALVLAAVGLYGVISYSVAQRTHEIGIRMALGAERVDVLKLVLGEGMILTLIGMAAGLAAALALTRVMSSMLYGAGTTDPATFAVISLLLLGVAAFASYIPARRATQVDPNVALRCE